MAQSLFLLQSTGTNDNVIGDPVRADGWYGRVDHVYTVAVYVSNLEGTVYLEASLADAPTGADWFNIITPLVYPSEDAPDDGGETATAAFTFRGNYTWIRARLVRTGTGSVDRILINQ